MRKAFFILPILSMIVWGCSSRPAQQTQKTVELKAQSEKRREVKIKVIENEPTLQGSRSVIAGSVQNVSAESLNQISIVFELIRRDTGAKEVREVNIQPSSLSPRQEGKFSLTLSNREWSGSRILKVISPDTQQEGLAFIYEPGVKRPPERFPEVNKTIIVQRPKPKGEEFLNSPDDAVPIP